MDSKTARSSQAARSAAVTRRTFAGLMGALAGTAFAATAAGASFSADPAWGAEDAQEGGATFTPGTYTAQTYGMLGQFDVSGTFSENRLESLEPGENSETKRVGKEALRILSERIVDDQTLAVDSVTGATYSSRALISAAEDLVEQAGSTVEDFSRNESRVPTYEGQPTDADILIAGCGLAGVCAAISAAQNGANVIVLEALRFAAGNAALSTGSFLLGGGTSIQKALGIEETPEEFRDYINETSYNMKDPAAVDRIVDNSQAIIDWFAGIGIGFADELTGGTTGNHSIAPSIGDALTTMNEKAVELGVDIRYGTKGQELLLDESGAVTGIRATDYDGNEVDYTARRVVLASGGYADNPELIGKTWGESYSHLVYGGLKGMDGTLLIDAMDKGADTRDMDWPHIDACLEVTRGVTITTNILRVAGGIIIRTDGRRFVDEQSHHSEVAAATMHDLGDEYFYEIYGDDAREVSAAVGRKIDTYEAMKLPTIYDSLEDMAADLDIDPAVLQQTMDDYNAAVRGERPDEFGRTEFYTELVAPYHVIKVSNGVACTAGGLKIDETFRVISTAGEPIPNLYAIGEVSGGALAGYMGAESLSNASISGMLVGKQLAAEVAGA